MLQVARTHRAAALPSAPVHLRSRRGGRPAPGRATDAAHMGGRTWGGGAQYGQVAVSALGSGRACSATIIAFCPSCQLVARPLSVRRTGVHPSSLDPTSAGHFSCPGSGGLGVHAGQGPLSPRAAIVAGPIWPHLVGRCGGLRLKNLVGTGPVKVSAHTTHSIPGGGDTTCRSLRVVHMPSVAAAVRAVVHPALAVVAPVRAPLPYIDGWDLRSIPSSTGGGARCYRCVVPRCVFFLGRGGS